MRRPLADKRPIGPFAQGGRREIEIYMNTRLGGTISGEDTDELQVESRFANELESRLSNVGYRNTDVTFHPAGFTVGVEIDTGEGSVGRDDVDIIVDTATEYLESVYDVNVTLTSADRGVPAVEIRAR